MNEDVYISALKRSRAFKTLKNDVDNGSLGHAYLVITPDSEAVKYLFTMVAEAVFCAHGMCGECAECLRIKNRNNPDVTHFNLLEKAVKVEEISALIDDTYMRPLYSDKKLYMLYRVDLMSAKVQNKLLKTLEEPAGGVTFFLAASGEAAVLDTIKSRTRKVYLDAFTKEELQDAVADIADSPAHAEIAAICADGLLTRAIEFASSAARTGLYDDAVNMLKNTVADCDIVKITGSPCFSKDNLQDFLEVLSVVFRDVMLYRSNPQLVLSRHLPKEIAALAEHYSPSGAANAIRAINAAREAALVNVTAATLAEKMFLEILENRK